MFVFFLFVCLDFTHKKQNYIQQYLCISHINVIKISFIHSIKFVDATRDDRASDTSIHNCCLQFHYYGLQKCTEVKEELHLFGYMVYHLGYVQCCLFNGSLNIVLQKVKNIINKVCETCDRM